MNIRIRCIHPVNQVAYRVIVRVVINPDRALPFTNKEITQARSQAG